MTITPRVNKYRFRRSEAAAPAPSPLPEDGGALFEAPDDGLGPEPFPTAKGEDPELGAIRAEGLTGRQLRLARRVAQKHGIAAESDHEAVLLLRRKGIDPFDRNLLLQLVAPEDTPAAPTPPEPSRALAETGQPAGKLPQKARPAPPAPALNEGTRAKEIIRMQRDIARRRRRNLAMLGARLAVFVFLPTFLAGLYYYLWATPLYATQSEFVIQKADGMAGSGLGSLFSGTQLATSQDSITVQSYLQSRDAMLRLDQDLGFKAHFAQADIDALQRLAPDATNERAYKLYRRNVKIGYDPTEGLVRMEVTAADPQVSRQFSEALIGYAEEQVDSLTARLREDQMKGARESYADAEQKVLDAQARVLSLQEQMGILDPISESNALMTQVSGFEMQLQEKRLELRQLLDNPKPNEARVEGVRGDIARLEGLITDLRAGLTKADGASASLASVTGQLRIAEADLQTRQMMLSAAAQQLETARIEANKQVRYLEMGVRPVAPDEPTYPRAFENTLLAFLIFSGIYLMMSLTASILREQVSS